VLEKSPFKRPGWGNNSVKRVHQVGSQS
jgi:hypothetical protein